MLRIGIGSLDGLGGFQLHVAFAVFLIQIADAAQAGFGGDQIQGIGFAAQHLPHHALIFIAWNGHAHGGGIALRNGLDGDVIAHGFFLPQPLAGCIQKRQLARRILGKGVQLGFARTQISVQPLPVLVDFQNTHDIRQREAHILQRRDAADDGQLILAVIAVIGEAVNLGGFEQADLIIVAQHSDADPGQF